MAGGGYGGNPERKAGDTDKKATLGRTEKLALTALHVEEKKKAMQDFKANAVTEIGIQFLSKLESEGVNNLIEAMDEGGTGALLQFWKDNKPTDRVIGKLSTFMSKDRVGYSKWPRLLHVVLHVVT